MVICEKAAPADRPTGAAGGFSLDRYMSAQKGGAWDIPAGTAAKSATTPNRQTVPEDLRTRLEVPEDAPAKHLGPVKDGITAKTPSVRWKTPGEAGERDWKRTAWETFSAAGMMRFGAKADLDTKVKIAESKLPGLKEAEKEALARKNAAETVYNQPSGGLIEYLTGEQGRRMEDYTKAAGAYDAARSKREAAEQAAIEKQGEGQRWIL